MTNETKLTLFGEELKQKNWADASTQEFIFDEKKHKKDLLTDLLYEHVNSAYEKIQEIQLKNFCPICKRFPRYYQNTEINTMDTYFLKCECENVNIKVDLQ